MPLVLLAAFAVSVGLRVLVGGDAVAQSQSAGLVFAACLLVVSAAARTRFPLSFKASGLGLMGALLVCAPVGLQHLVSLKPLHGTEGFATWGLVVTVVATSEEVFLRGALYEAIADERVAIGVGAVAFALLHVPLYGWHVLPLDLAVGLVLGGLRREAGTPFAPAVAHVGADLVGWFLR
ncbi:MAG: family intrarane metalloprotease [Frankiales bacterium]|nr:family intrarane metalloprotease [Frankiales bacterium]